MMITFLEWFGSLSALAGAYMIATHTRISRYGWLSYLAANFAMIGFSIGIHRYGLLIQNLGFLGTTLLGIYKAGFPFPVFCRSQRTFLIRRAGSDSLTDAGDN